MPKTTCVLLAGVLVVGCASLRHPFHQERKGDQSYTEEQLREDLAEFAARFSAVVSAAADEIAQRADSRRVRRSTLLWKVKMIPMVREASFNDDPQEGYVENLNLSVAMRRYLVEGAGREEFGEYQPIAIGAARELEEDLLSMGRQFMNAQQMQALVAQVEALSREHPIRGPDFSVEAVAEALAKVEPTGSFLWIVDLPMSPFRALEGVGETGLALRELNQTAMEFAELVDTLPRDYRWQLELLLYDIEDRDTVIGGLAAFEQVAASAERVSQSIERLPDDLRAALADTQGTLVDANQIVVNAQALMEPVSATVAQLGQMTAQLAEMREEKSGEEPSGPPFDIREYQATAEAVTVSVTELRGLLDEVRSLLQTDQLDGTVIEVVDRTGDEMDLLIERATWRAVLLLVVFFALLLAYRWISSRIGRASA